MKEFALFFVFFQSIGPIFGCEIHPIQAPVTNLSLSIVWDDCTQSIYYVDFLTIGQQPSIFRYDYNENKVYSAYVEEISGFMFILPIKECNKYKNLFLVGSGHYAYVIEWDGISPVARKVNTLLGVEENDPESLLNVARQSEQGRLYFGTFHNGFCQGPSNSSLYMYSEKGVQQLVFGSKSTTGLAFDSDARRLYHVDSCLQQITGYRADQNGDICEGRVVFDFSKLGLQESLNPIGLETDTHGRIYTSTYYNGEIWRINPWTSNGRIIAKLPLKGTGGVAFGGPDRNVLFAVSGSTIVDVMTAQVIEQLEGTSLYKIICLGAKGRKYSRLII